MPPSYYYEDGRLRHLWGSERQKMIWRQRYLEGGSRGLQVKVRGGLAGQSMPVFLFFWKCGNAWSSV